MSNYRHSTGMKRPRWGGKKARGQTSQGRISQAQRANQPGGKRAKGRTSQGRTSQGAKETGANKPGGEPAKGRKSQTPPLSSINNLSVNILHNPSLCLPPTNTPAKINFLRWRLMNDQIPLNMSVTHISLKQEKMPTNVVYKSEVMNPRCFN